MKVVISHSKTYANPYLALDIMQQESLSGDVDTGFSVVGGDIEHRITITLYDAAVPQAIDLFLQLRQEYDLDCAWFEHEDFAGCIKKHPQYNPDNLNRYYKDKREWMDFYDELEVDLDEQDFYDEVGDLDF